MNDGDQSVHFLYLVAILVLLGSILVVRRLAIAPGLRFFVGVVQIFAIAFISFTFKDEFLAFGNRLVIVTRGGVEDASVPGEIRIRQATDGHFWVTADVNGEAVRFLIDSGATTTSITRDTALRVGIAPTPGVRPVVQTANGVVRVDSGRAATFKVGTIERRNVDVHISDAFGDLNVIGMNFLSSLSAWGVEGRTLLMRS